MDAPIPADLKIPEGWTRLAYGPGIRIQRGDRYLDTAQLAWIETSIEPGTPVPPTVYIRKNG